MIGRVLEFVRLPLVLLVIYAAARFSLGLAGVPYAPRGNAMVSVVELTIISSIYFALSGKVGGFGWAGTYRKGPWSHKVGIEMCDVTNERCSKDEKFGGKSNTDADKHSHGFTGWRLDSGADHRNRVRTCRTRPKCARADARQIAWANDCPQIWKCSS